MGEVLIGSMAEVAGDAVEAGVHAAWQEAYGVVQDVMLKGQPPRRE